MDDSLPAPAPAGSAPHQMKAIIPKSSTRDWNTITTMLHSAGSATAKGRTTKEFRVARLKMRMRVCSVGMVHSRPEKEFQRRGPAQERTNRGRRWANMGQAVAMTSAWAPAIRNTTTASSGTGNRAG